MAVPSNTYVTSSAVGIYENLHKAVTNIDPVDKILLNSIDEYDDEVTQTKQEWTIDSLRASASNAHDEGDDTTTQAITAAVRRYNIQQIFKESFRLSGSIQKANAPSGLTKEAYQTTKKLKELSKDIERGCWRGVRNDTDTRQMRGILNWLTTNLSMDAGATLNADGTVSGGANRALTPDMIKEVSHNCYNRGGKPDTLVCTTTQAGKISDFANLGNYRQMVEGGKLNDYVDVYRTETGTYKTKIHRDFPTDVIAIMEWEYWKKATWRPTRKEPLSKTGDSDRWHIVCEMTVVALQEASSGRIVNLEN